MKSYITGFISSVVLTLVAYSLIEIHINSAHETFSHEFLTFAIIALAIVQLVVQLIYFLHLNNETGARWNLVVFISTISIILILVVGSIWIMNHLNYNMTPADVNAYMKDQGSL